MPQFGGNREGTLLFVPDVTKGLYQVAASGSSPVPVLELDKSKYKYYVRPVLRKEANVRTFLFPLFFWGRGYEVFSVSQSNLPQVVRYIKTQEEHHRKKSFLEEYEGLVKRYGLRWVEEETVETVSKTLATVQTPR